MTTTHPPPTVVRTSKTRGIDFPGSEIESYKAITHALLDNAGLEWGPNKVNRIAIKYAKRRITDLDFADAIAAEIGMTRERLRASDTYKAIRYADPTGETAVFKILNPEQYRILNPESETP